MHFDQPIMDRMNEWLGPQCHHMSGRTITSATSSYLTWTSFDDFDSNVPMRIVDNITRPNTEFNLAARTIVFVNTCQSANNLQTDLARVSGVEVSVVHGQMVEGEREFKFNQFMSRKSHISISTRGIMAKQINYNRVGVNNIIRAELLEELSELCF